MKQQTDFRALCAELLDEVAARPLILDRELIDRARAALAEPVAAPAEPTGEELGLIYHDCCRGCEFMDQCGFEDAARAVLAHWGRAGLADGPAVPEGREPAAVVEQPSDKELNALWNCSGIADEHGNHTGNIFEFARIVLARWGQQPAPPADGEVAELAVFLRGCADDHHGHGRRQFTRAAELLERQAAPVPVAWCNSGDFLAASAKRQSFNGWLEQHSDCDMALCIAQLPAHALAAEAVVEGPSLEEVECLCEEHCFNVEGYESIECLQGLINEAITRWGRHAPAPAEGELAEPPAELVEQWMREASDQPPGPDARVIAALAARWGAAQLLERQAAPVPAGEVAESSVAPVPEPALARINGILSDSGRVLLTDVREALELARQALEQRQTAPEPEVVGPTDEELLELWQGWNLGWDPQKGMVLMPHPAEYARAVLARWGRPVPAPAEERQAAPVPVAERLPGPGDCDAEGRCWWGRPESDDWSADWTLATPEAIAEFCEFSPRVTWLPFNALPLPSGEVG